ncbi:MAG: DUF6701 domain-containing protein [Pseudomonadota bacterium]
MKQTVEHVLRCLAVVLACLPASVHSATYAVVQDNANFRWENTTHQAEFKTSQCSGWAKSRDDTITDPIDLGFTFNFAGTTFSKVRIMSNGVLEFASQSCEYRDLTVPSPNWNQALSPYATDLVLPSNQSSDVTFEAIGNAPNRRFVVTYSKLKHYRFFFPAYGSYTFQAIVYENGNIAFQYGKGDADGSDGAIGVEINDGDYTAYTRPVGNGTRLLFTRGSPPPTPGAFNAVDTGADALTGKIHTKVAARPFALDIAALNSARTGVLSNYSGTVKVELLDSSDNAGPLDPATGCRSTWVVKKILGSLSFNNQGRMTLSGIQWDDALRDARIRITETTPSRGIYSCSADNFAIRPDHFVLTVTDGDRRSAGTTNVLNNTGTTGTPIHNAGQPFTITATAVNAAGKITPNYLNAMPTTTASLVTGTVPGTFTPGTWTTIAGKLFTNDATYSEVGAFALGLADTSFTAVDAGDGSTPAERSIGSPANNGSPATADVGRFVPDHFLISNGIIRNRTDPATLAGCTNLFSYLGERFDAIFTISAENASGGVTQNYAGALAHLPFVPDDGNTANGEWRIGTSNGTLASRVQQIAIQGAFINGVASGVQNGMRILRAGTAPNFTPDGPFPNTPITADPVDADGVTLPSVATVSSTSLYFGRLVADNAYGSELLPLPMWARTQYWDSGSAGWKDMSGDTCTLYAIAPPAGTMLGQNSAGDGRGYWTSANYGGTGGQLYPPDPNGHLAGWALWYTAGGQGGNFPVPFANHSYLISQPGTASFGRFQGNKRVIYWRERFD